MIFSLWTVFSLSFIYSIKTVKICGNLSLNLKCWTWVTRQRSYHTYMLSDLGSRCLLQSYAVSALDETPCLLHTDVTAEGFDRANERGEKFCIKIHTILDIYARYWKLFLLCCFLLCWTWHKLYAWCDGWLIVGFETSRKRASFTTSLLPENLKHNQNVADSKMGFSFG